MFTKRSARQAPYVPRLEFLEDRVVPSCIASEDGDVLRVTGDRLDNTILIRDNGDGRFTVACEGRAAQSFTGIDHIVVVTRDGNDTVTYRLEGTQSKSFLTIDVHLGAGNDIARLDASPGVVDNALQVFYVAAGDGDDHVLGHLGHLIDADVAFLGNLGNGNDGFQLVQLAGLGDDSSLDLDIDGREGLDRFNFVATSNVFVSGESEIEVEFDGDESNALLDLGDRMTVRYAGQMDGDLAIDFDGDDGNDSMSAELVLNSGSSGLVDVFVDGDDGVDSFSLSVDDRSAGRVDFDIHIEDTEFRSVQGVR